MDMFPHTPTLPGISFPKTYSSEQDYRKWKMPLRECHDDEL